MVDFRKIVLATRGMAMIRRFGKLLRDCRGATAVEYGLIISLVVIGCLGALSILAGATTDIWTDVSTKVDEAG
jgi:pilus assembly protein Flp/PilA